MAQSQSQQQQQGGFPWRAPAVVGGARSHAANGTGPGCRHPPGRLLLAHIQTLQQQQQPGQHNKHPSASQQARNSSPASGSTAALSSSSRSRFNEMSSLALAESPNGPGSISTSGDASQRSGLPHFKLPQQQLDHELQQQWLAAASDTAASAKQQQEQQVVPFWRSSEQAGVAAHSLQQQQQHQQWDPHQQPQEQRQQQQQQQRPPPQGSRHGGSNPQFASATISGSSKGGGSSGSGSGSDSPTGGLRAVGRAMFNGEACKILGFVGAQLLVHLATLQRGMHQLHSQQHDADGEQQQEQQHHHTGPFAGWRLRMPWQRPDGPGGRGDGAGAGAHSGAGGGGAAAWQAGDAAKQWMVKGVAAERALDLRGALACYTNAVTLEPANREYLCRLAKQWSDLTYEEGATVEQIQEVNAKAIEYAERVIAMAPKAADGHMASCVSRGRLALFSDNKTKVRLAKEAQEAARTAVALDPSNDLAHHLMGRWHYEMAQINFMVRQLIRVVYGAALAPGTFEDALREFSTAAALNPVKLIHRVELGRTHLRLGHKAAAYEHLTASMALDVEDINAKLQKEDAELLLAKLRAELKGRTELPASWGGFTSPGIVQIEDITPSGSSSSSLGAASSSSGGSSSSSQDSSSREVGAGSSRSSSSITTTSSASSGSVGGGAP